MEAGFAAVVKIGLRFDVVANCDQLTTGYSLSMTSELEVTICDFKLPYSSSVDCNMKSHADVSERRPYPIQFT